MQLFPKRGWNGRENLKKYMRDFLFLGVFIGIGILLLLVLSLAKPEGAMVQIKVAGELTECHPLDEDKELFLLSPNGTNRVIIQGGEVFVSEASCADQLCVHMGKIHRVSQSIICLPNQVVVEITGEQSEGKDSEIDAVLW